MRWTLPPYRACRVGEMQMGKYFGSVLILLLN
jgi:hypothetical protein